MLLRSAVADLLDQRVPLYLSLVVAVFAAAAYGGLKAGLLATALCVLVGTWLFPGLPEPSPMNRTRILVFFVEGLAISCSFEAMHRARQRLQEKKDQLEDEIKQRQAIEQELVSAARRKNQFLATLAHELRNPLAPIRNCLEIMRQTHGDPTHIEQARIMMERQVNHMVRLVDDLLDVSRISRNKIELRSERVALGDIIQQAVETSRPCIEAAQHELTVNLPSQPILVEADPVRLIQVFANLLNNAAKYTERGGHIWLNARCLGGEAAVAVRDNGIGIPADMLGQVFDMFTQVEQSLDRSQGGLGIGLTLVKKLVEMHGGSVEAHSQGPGQGSEFVVRLPCCSRIPAPAVMPDHARAV
jgi:signal transduction histidine kinase